MPGDATFVRSRAAPEPCNGRSAERSHRHWFTSGSAHEDDRVRAQHAEADRLQEVLAPLRIAHPDIELVPTTRVGGATEVLTDEARRACLLVVGRHDRKHRGVGHLGAVAHAAIHYARCPVAVVPRD